MTAPLESDICPSFRPEYDAIKARLDAAGHPTKLLAVLRTLLEEQGDVLKGTSHTMHSFHLPQELCPTCGKMPNSLGTIGLSHAVDLAPDPVDWDTRHDPTWAAIVAAAYAHGCISGENWMNHPDTAPHSPRDWGHIQPDWKYYGPTDSVPSVSV